MPSQQYSDQEILEALRSTACELGHTASMNTWQALGRRPWPKTIADRFGSWDEALQAAGLEPAPPRSARRPAAKTMAARKMPDRDAITRRLREVALELGHSPSSSEWAYRCERPQTHRIFAAFGTWQSALAAAGLPAVRPRSRAHVLATARSLQLDSLWLDPKHEPQSAAPPTALSHECRARTLRQP